MVHTEREDERNLQLYKDREKGMTYSELGVKYKISRSRARVIYTKMKKQKELSKCELFILLEYFSDDEKLTGKTYSVFQRERIDTVEKAAQLTQKDYKNMRGCGPKMETLIRKVVETSL